MQAYRGSPWLRRQEQGSKESAQGGFVPPYTSVCLRYGEERRVLIRIGTEHSAGFASLASEYFDADGLLLPEAENPFELFLERAAKIDEAFRCYDDALAFVLSRREAARRKSLLEAKYAAPESFESLLKARLYPYQRRGILFSATTGRSLIADEMGLGKTIQAIGAALLLKREAGVEQGRIVRRNQ
jgi:hypothetical protein